MKKYDKEIMQAQLDNEKQVLKKLESNYEDALEEINSKIANLMGRADADMQHVIYQVEYQKALKKQIEGILLQLQTNEFETVSEYLTKSYEEGFLGTMYSMQSQGVPLIFPINQEEIVAAIQHETNLSSSLYQAFDMKDLQKKIAGEISRGFSTGALYKDVARNVAAVTNIGKNKAMTIARTEGHRITEAAAYNAQQKAKDRGADVVKIWDAALDSKTRPSHVKVDGEVRELDEKYSNGLKYPGDPSGAAAEVINCRCRSRTDARWALDADETKILGDTSKMTEAQKKAIADKLNIPVEDIDLYSDQVIPIKAKNYADFKKQYNQLWNYEGSELAKEVEPRIAKLEQARTGKTSKEDEPIIRKPSFKPASTIGEAEEYAKKYVDTHYQSKYSGNISYKGVGIDAANKMNKVLTEVFANYDVPQLNNLKPMNFRENRFKSAVEDGVAAAYQWMSGGTMFINQKIFASEKVTSAFVKKADDLLKKVVNGVDVLLDKSGLKERQRIYLNALKKTGIQCFSQTPGIDFTEATFVHEAGHMLDDKIFRKLFKENDFDLSASMAKYAGNVSGYAVSSNAEYIAESFSAFWYGKTDNLDPDLVKIFKLAQSTATKNAVDNVAKNGIISPVKTFAKGSKDFPTVILPKDEYAHVMSEIATNLTAEQNAKTVFKKAVGKYVYVVENNGFGNYRVIGKELIED